MNKKKHSPKGTLEKKRNTVGFVMIHRDTLAVSLMIHDAIHITTYTMGAVVGMTPCLVSCYMVVNLDHELRRNQTCRKNEHQLSELSRTAVLR